MQKEHKMQDIPNTEYITIKKEGVFVGGQPAIYYRGKKMHSQSLTQTYFLYLQEKFPVIEECHVLSSKTEAKLYNTNEQPSQQDGKYMPSIFPSIRVFLNESAPSHQVAKVLEFQLQHQSFQ